ncbi:MAG: OB-fold nucleic acid binding domain-containing protein [Candidatus Wukongarchaeota archaeon]|nr:OB-fold nucleic acid binding domain-containing protein [Candidatus Wukongarchaeota archaeon]
MRQTTSRARISDIVNGNFIRKEGFEPSYVLTDLGQRISRTYLIGTIVDKFMSENGNYSSITIDDDSDSIRIKAFREQVNIFDNFNVGDLVMVIGKVRNYADENYVIPEIVKKITDPNLESLHKLEVLKRTISYKKALEIVKKEKENFGDVEKLKKYVKKHHGIDEDVADSILETLTTEEETKEKDYKPLLLETLDRLDDGEGVEFKKLLEESKLTENVFEETINEILSDGICFEPKPGIIKRV